MEVYVVGKPQAKYLERYRVFFHLLTWFFGLDREAARFS